MPAKLISLEWVLGQSFDDTVKKLVFVDSVHHEVHEGIFFNVEHSANVANGNSLEMLITTGAGQAHAAFAIAAGGQITLYFFEGTAKTGGTGLTPRNMNRNKSDNTEVVVAHTPAGAGDGTAVINGRLLPGGTTQQTRVGGAARANTEIILKPSTKYLLRATNTSGGAIDINPVFSYYIE
jgi:hypothetical protein